MDYILAKEAAEKWGITVRRVQVLAKENRIPGVKLVGKTWMIPADAQKPEDIRKTTDVTYYRFPLLISGNYSEEYVENYFSEDEKKILLAEKLSVKNKKEESNRLFLELIENSNNEMIIIEACYNLVYNYVYLEDDNNHRKYFSMLRDAVNNASSHKKELEILLYDAELCTIGISNSTRGFEIDASCRYSKEALYTLAITEAYSMILRYMPGNNEENPNPLMIIALECESEGYDFCAHLLYLQLSIIWSLRGDDRKSFDCLSHAFDIAIKNEYYTYISSIGFFAPLAFGKVIESLSEDKRDFINSLIENGYHVMMSKKENREMFNQLTSDDYRLISYAIWKIKLKHIAAIEACSVTTISNRYSVLYCKLGVSNKAELLRKTIEYFK